MEMDRDTRRTVSVIESIDTRRRVILYDRRSEEASSVTSRHADVQRSRDRHNTMAESDRRYDRRHRGRIQYTGNIQA